MIKNEMLLNLERNISEKQAFEMLRYSNIIVDVENRAENKRCRILEFENRFFFHAMQNGEIMKCFEIVESWRPFDNVTIWAYTPDGTHIAEIDSRNIEKHCVLNRTIQEFSDGASFTDSGNTVILDGENLVINGKKISVVSDSQFIFNLKSKKNIHARDGASGLYSFLEHISFAKSNKLYEYPLFVGVLNKIVDRYCDCPITQK